MSIHRKQKRAARTIVFWELEGYFERAADFECLEEACVLKSEASQLE